MNALIPLLIACNGSPALCDRKFDQVVYPTTHNSTSVIFDRHPIAFIPNQEKGVATQLREGIRAFMIDAWDFKNKVYACHASCVLGGQPMQNPLKDIKNFLDQNPNEVLTIIFESYVSSKEMTEEFIKAGLLSYVATLPAQGDFPTLREMISHNQRLVVLTDKKDDGPDWYQDVWALAVETPYSFKNSKEFTCNYNRGKKENPLYIINHFLTKALFRHAFNRKPGKLKAILARARKCAAQNQRIPNFLTVDFYRSSGVVKAAAELNR